jgi:hypothetical protein
MYFRIKVIINIFLFPTMLPQNFGQLLYNAVRETLETMAFAEVIPFSIKVGEEECALSDEFSVQEAGGGWGGEPPADSTDAAPADAWGTATLPVVPAAAAVVTPLASPTNEGDSWGTPSAEPLPAEDAWGTPNAEPVSDDVWGSGISEPGGDAWGDSQTLGDQVSPLTLQSKKVNFDELVENQDDWCWACMKVNSPDIHSVWFIVSKGLANALAENMYAGENFELTNPLIRDIIAELTNVLGGRLMLLLEELGGKFTLTVPEIGFGMPEIPESHVLETVMCKVVVDGEYPVMVALCFNESVK